MRATDMKHADALPVDPLWPRAGDWPAPSGSAPYSRVDVALIGVPTHATSISTTNAHETPDAVRAMLPRYSEFTHSEFRHGAVGSAATGRDLTFADYGNILDPDGDEQAAIQRIAEVEAELLIALGGDNAATVPTALGRWGSRIGTAGLVTVDAHYDL